MCLKQLIEKNWETEIEELDRSIIAGLLNVVGGWPSSVRPTAKVILNTADYQQNTECVLTGGNIHPFTY